MNKQLDLFGSEPKKTDILKINIPYNHDIIPEHKGLIQPFLFDNITSVMKILILKQKVVDIMYKYKNSEIYIFIEFSPKQWKKYKLLQFIDCYTILPKDKISFCPIPNFYENMRIYNTINKEKAVILTCITTPEIK